MDWLIKRREQALQQEQLARNHSQLETLGTNSLAKRRRSSVRPQGFRPTVDSTTSMPSTSESTTSRLLALPPELRNLIYSHLFNEENVQLIKPAYRFPGLLLANKKIYTEATSFFYSASTFRCLDEDSTVAWLSNLPLQWLKLIPEVKYDTRWIIFVTPVIPVPGAEVWLYRSLVRRLEEKGFDLSVFEESRRERVEEGWAGEVGEEEARGTGKLKISYYQGGKGGGIRWTDKPGLIEVVRN